jgi:tetratricopeptide (TPR) repeat protein
MTTRERKLRSFKVFSETVIGAAGGLLSALVLAAILVLIVSGRGYGQPVSATNQAQPAPDGPRTECESGARTERGDARALGACDILLHDTRLSESERGQVLVNRAVNQIRRGNAPAALTDLDQAADLLPQSGAVALNRAAALIELRRYQDAEEAANTALSQTLNEPALAWLNLAIALEGQDRFHEARDAYLEAAELDGGQNALIARQPARFDALPPADTDR